MGAVGFLAGNAGYAAITRLSVYIPNLGILEVKNTVVKNIFNIFDL
jgi:hypothetical protein